MSIVRAALFSALLVNIYSADLNDKIGKAADYFATFAVRQEMSHIAEMAYIDHVTGDLPPPAQFSEYLRHNMVVRGAYHGRDTSRDFWGTPYRLQIVNGFPDVVSAGPDGIFGTADDLHSTFSHSYLDPGPARAVASTAQDSRPSSMFPPPNPNSKRSPRIIQARANHWHFHKGQRKTLRVAARTKTHKRPIVVARATKLPQQPAHHRIFRRFVSKVMRALRVSYGGGAKRFQSQKPS